MKSLFIVIGSLLLCLLLTDCATIVGGQRYHAHVLVKDNPDAEIRYNGQLKGVGTATFKVDRKKANEFVFQVQEDGCNTQQFTFNSRIFRGWSLAGTIITWTGVYFIPWGVMLDGITGAWWKPDVDEMYVSKIDWDNWAYNVDYKGCGSSKPSRADYYDGTDLDESPEPVKGKSKADRLREIKDLFDEGILTEEEYQKEKTKILNEE